VKGHALLTIAVESPLSADGLALIAGSETALAKVFRPDEIFTLDPQQLAVPEIRFFVARDHGVPVGCVALMHCGGYGEIKRLYVSGKGRGKGTARALMAALEADAQAQGLAVMRLETGPVLAPAIALYRSLGYLERGRFGDYADHPASLFMEKQLGAAP